MTPPVARRTVLRAAALASLAACAGVDLDEAGPEAPDPTSPVSLGESVSVGQIHVTEPGPVEDAISLAGSDTLAHRRGGQPVTDRRARALADLTAGADA